MAADGFTVGQRFRLTGRLNWRRIDGVWLVHSSASGATLAAEAVDAVLLELLTDGPATAQGLAIRLAAQAACTLPPDAVVGLEERLQHWLQSGWVIVADD